MRDRQRTWQYAIYRCRRGLCLWILGLLLPPLLAQAEQFTGKVVGIRTGDTLSVLRNARVVQVRLYGVACPNAGKPLARKRASSRVTSPSGRRLPSSWTP